MSENLPINASGILTEPGKATEITVITNRTLYRC